MLVLLREAREREKGRYVKEKRRIEERRIVEVKRL